MGSLPVHTIEEKKAAASRPDAVRIGAPDRRESGIKSKGKKMLNVVKKQETQPTALDALQAACAAREAISCKLLATDTESRRVSMPIE